MKNVALLLGLACFTSCSTLSGLPPVGAEVYVSVKNSGGTKGIVRSYSGDFLHIDRTSNPTPSGAREEHIRVSEIIKWLLYAPPAK